MAKPDSKAFRWRALFASALLGPALAAAAFSRPLIAEGSVPDLILYILGWPLFVGGAVLRFWATLYVGGRKGRRVVSEGPYSLCRHPLYLGSFSMATSAAFFLGSPTVLVAVLLVGAIYVLFTIPAEERHLLEELGEEYRSYCQRTPRLLPHIQRPRGPDFIEVKVRSLWLELRRSFLLFLIPVVCEVLETLRTNPYWPHPFHLP